MSELTDKGRQNLHAFFLTKFGATAGDHTTTFENIINHGYTHLCMRCDGSGNELLSMYKKCEKCDGTGRDNA